ncbi:hypothetical protein VHEMI09341 [[Torrubiella] hemipterigena]|uniref:Phosphoinositide phospholipase C n=1 Tax=[Torrubiella] hemipterigena TaxID=1531966 RepID=A0A0A1TRC8_9HYPO|nr:hypothetical protein VHEMI09341 [[Torrubiella] hemipterigena]
MSELSAKLKNLNPFSKSDDEEKFQDEDAGGNFGIDSVGLGGSRFRVGKDELRVSQALRSFIAENKILSEKDAGVGAEGHPLALKKLLANVTFEVPQELRDRSHPLPDYYISSSHNTYLMAHQLYGKSSAAAYETALKTGSRCVEIDAWDNSDDKDEPKVTHGFTLVSHIPFRKVCETIKEIYDVEKAQSEAFFDCQPGPIVLSLENHCSEYGQKRLVEIMKEVFGGALLSEPIIPEGKEDSHDPAEHITLGQLGFKIVVIVEYHWSGEVKEVDATEYVAADFVDEVEEAAHKEYEEMKQAEKASPIIPELAALGVYAQSVKPRDNSWFDPGELLEGPHHHLINVSESGLGSHLPEKAEQVAIHNSKHLMRVYPKGTRIGSSNLKPVKFWGVGAQICALNWQTFGTSCQLNEALFAGSDGYVLKPEPLRIGGSGKIGTGKKKKLILHVGGATDIPVGDDRGDKSFKPYLTCTIYSPLMHGDAPKRKTAAYKHHKLGLLHRGDNPEATDPIWDEKLEWEYDDTDLVFLRMLIKSDDAWARNPMFAVAAVRLQYTIPGWTFVRMLDMQGRETSCTVLLNFEIVDI